MPVAPTAFVHVVPASVLVCHCSVTPAPVAAPTKKAGTAPGRHVAAAGCSVTTGSAGTVSVAAALVAEPDGLVATTR